LRLVVYTLAGFCIGFLFCYRIFYDFNGHPTLYTETTAFRIFHGKTGISFEKDFFGNRYTGNTYSWPDRNVFWYGAYEKEILFFLRDYLLEIAQNKPVFLDVGANTGQHSIFAAQHSHTVHAFDPFLPVIDQLDFMVESNQIDNIFVHKVGLGNEDSVEPFYLPPDDILSTGSFQKNLHSYNKSESIDLRIVVGDDYLKKQSINKVDLIKIDIEGFEKPALKGLASTLQQNRPVIVMEISIRPSETFTFVSLEELFDHMPEDYEIMIFEKDRSMAQSGEYRFRENDLNFSKSYRENILLFPKEKKELLPSRVFGLN